MPNDRFSLSMKGSYQDTLIWDSINGFKKTEVRPWKTNQIQDSALRSISERLTGYSEYPTNTYSHWGSIRHMKLGQGDVSWDTTAPTKSFTATDLEDPQYNKSLSVSDFDFLDASNNTTSIVSAGFRLSVTIGTSEANGLALREFGLFTGDATSLPFQWNMFNWVDHPVINKDINLSIQRTVDIQLEITRS